MLAARIHRALQEIPTTDWDALHDGRNPFVAHAIDAWCARQRAAVRLHWAQLQARSPFRAAAA